MIISASRRTDIPAHYADWFFARLAAGFCGVKNPYNPNQIRRVGLRRQDVDGFVFWTKNPAPMLDRLSLLEGYPYYFHCTLTGASAKVEPGLPDKKQVLLPAVLRLAEAAGPQRVVWRFDPIVFGGPHTPEGHAGQFSFLAQKLAAAGVNSCIFSFYTPYAAVQKRMAAAGVGASTAAQRRETVTLLCAEARRFGITLHQCAGSEDYADCSVLPARCIDASRLSAIAGREIVAKKDKNQRPHCGCDESVDIGAYGSCPSGCLYCYAVRGGVGQFCAQHRPQTDEGLGLRQLSAM